MFAERSMWMMKMRKGISLILLVCLATSLGLSVACSTDGGSDWVGATPLEEALSNGKPTVAEFGAATCIPCKRMKPVLEEIVAEYGDKLNLSFTDVRIHTNLATKYRISLMPTQIFFDSGGQEVTRHVGFWPKEDILTHLQELGLL
jgi:thioredoxin 1